MIKIIETKEYRTHKIKINPNSQMRNYLNNCIGYRRYLYNKCLELYKKYHEEHKEELNIKDRYITENALKKIIDNTQLYWESDLSSSIRDTAVSDFYKAVRMKMVFKQNNFPKFHSKSHSTQSFTFNPGKSKQLLFKPENNKKFRPLMGKSCKIKSEYRWISMTEKVRFKGKIIRVNIVKEYDEFFAFFVIELDRPIPKQRKPKDKYLHKQKHIIGIDLGLKQFTHDSDDLITTHITKQFNNMKAQRKALVYQSRMGKLYDKKKKPWKQSKNYYRARAKHRIELRKVANSKTNFYHQITTYYASKSSNIVIEDLNNKDMRAKKTQPNQFLRKQLSHISFYEFRRLLEYKAKNLILVDRYFPSTQLCSNCGNRKTGKEKMKLHNRVYKCKICGYEIDRDYNAALNIRKDGIRQLKLVGAKQPVIISKNI